MVVVVVIVIAAVFVLLHTSFCRFVARVVYRPFQPRRPALPSVPAFLREDQMSRHCLRGVIRSNRLGSCVACIHENDPLAACMSRVSRRFLGVWLGHREAAVMRTRWCLFVRGMLTQGACEASPGVSSFSVSVIGPRCMSFPRAWRKHV